MHPTATHAWTHFSRDNSWWGRQKRPLRFSLGVLTRRQATRAGWSKVAGQQALVGVSLGALLAVGGFVRVFLTSDGNVVEAAAIAFSLGTIVSTSVLAGATLPFMLAWVGVDPANAGTTVQVVMDILGVTVRGALTHHVTSRRAGG